MEPNQIIIDLFSDFACPWCYVGEKRLQKAIELFAKDNNSIQIKINYHPYMIDPSISAQGEGYLEYNKKRWGGDYWAIQMKETVLKEGIQFKNWAFWPNTLQLHTLMLYAQSYQKEQKVNEILFRKIYENGLCACDIDELKNTAIEAGLEGDNAIEFITNKENQNQVKKEDRKAKDRDIDGVPYFVIKYGKKVEEMGGAQKPELLKFVLTQIITQ